MIKQLGQLLTVSISCAFLGIVSGAMLGGLLGALVYYGAMADRSHVHFQFTTPLIAMALGAMGGLMAGLIGGSFSGLPGFWVGGLIGGVFSAALLPPHHMPPIALIYVSAAVGALFGVWIDWQLRRPTSPFPVVRRCQAVFKHCSVSDVPLWMRYSFGALVAIGCVFVVLNTLALPVPAQPAPNSPARHLLLRS